MDPMVGLRQTLMPKNPTAPLLCAEKRFGIIWSPKSASVQVLLWYLCHMDLVDALQERWPHDFRERVLFRDPAYIGELQSDPLKDVRWLRVIRDPSKRAVSSFRHSLMYGYDEPGLARMLGRRVDAEHGFSFREWVGYLSGLPAELRDAHTRPQHSATEQFVTADFTVNVDKVDIWAAIAAFEAEAGIAPIPARHKRWLSSRLEMVAIAHHATRAPAQGAADMTFKRAKPPRIWPRHEDFLDEAAMVSIAEAYAEDLRAYAAYL